MATQSTQKISREWKETTLGEAAEKIGMGPFGSNIKVETFVDAGIPVISGVHLRGTKLEDKEYNFVTEKHAEDLKSANAFPGDVVFTHAGNIGQVAFIPQNSKYKKYILSQRQFYLRPNKEKLLPEFITYYFKTREGQYKLLANTNQTGVPSIARPVSYLRSITVALPLVSEQQAIVAVLASLDNKIEFLQEQNKTLESTAHSIFREWFDRGENGSQLKQVADLIEFNPREKVSMEQEYLFFDMKCLSEDSMAISEGVRRKANSASTFRENDTLMAKITPCLENGKTGFMLGLGREEIARGSTEFIVMRAKRDCNPFFVYCLARSQNFRNLAIKSMTGTSGRQRVQVELLGKYKVTIRKGSMLKFHKISEPIFKKIKNNYLQIRTLSKVRDSSLPKLMRGDVRVKKYG